MRYVDGHPVEVTTVVISTQHSPDANYEKIREAIIEELIKKTIPEQYLTSSTIYHVNPTGSFIIGGPHGDCGLTGRKIIVDTYGGYGRHGGGAFSGKDPSKVDRSACYMARHVAKNVVAAGLAKQVRNPGRLRDRRRRAGLAPDRYLRHRHRARQQTLVDLARAVRFPARRNYQDPRPEAADLSADRRLRAFRPHPHDGLFPWERVDMAETLRSAFGINGRG